MCQYSRKTAKKVCIILEWINVRMLRSTHSTSGEQNPPTERNGNNESSRRKGSAASIISEYAYSDKERSWSVLDARVCLPAILNDPRHR